MHFDDNIPGALYTLGRPDPFLCHLTICYEFTDFLLPVQVFSNTMMCLGRQLLL